MADITQLVFHDLVPLNSGFDFLQVHGSSSNSTNGVDELVKRLKQVRGRLPASRPEASSTFHPEIGYPRVLASNADQVQKKKAK
jgi:hypothetical protein